jgi:glutamine amidotransferase
MIVAVVDYGSGNLGSVLRAIEELGATPILATMPNQIEGARRLVLPGVGSFTDSMNALKSGGWIEPLSQAVGSGKVPLLGVCVGMQLLASEGEEGAEGGSWTPGLGFIPGQVRHLNGHGCTERLPHVGWNSLIPTATDPLLNGIPEGTAFYFVHSYALVASNPAHVIATVRHGVSFTAVVRSGNVWGTQFHPEKSSRAGFRLLRNFLSI